MVQGHDTGHGTARGARRLARWWGTDAGAARDVPRARPAAAAADTWFDDWLTATPSEVAGTRRALARTEAAGWTVRSGLHRPGSAHAGLEHVAVGPGGVVVVETLLWDGEVSVEGGTLRHRGYGRTPDVAEVAGAAGAIAALVAPSHRRTVQAVLCLAGRDLEPVPVCGGAVVVGENQLADHLLALPVQVAAEDLPLLVDYLTAELSGAASPELLTVDDVFRPASVWAAPEALPARTAEAGGAAPEPVGDASGYRPPLNVLPDGHPDQSPERPVAGPLAGSSRGAVGDRALRLGMLVLGLLTAGNVLLAWLDAAR